MPLYPPAGSGGGGSSLVIPFHKVGAGWSHTCVGADQSFGGYAATLNAVVPSAGNLFLAMYAIGSIKWAAVPPDATLLAYLDSGWEVDGVGGSQTTAFDQERFNTGPGLFSVSRTLASPCVIACPAAATRVVKVNFFINGDLAGAGHHNIDLLTADASVHGIFVPGTPLSDGGEFTP